LEPWLPKYPTIGPWADDAVRAAFRRSEDAWLAQFEDLKSLSQIQVSELIAWKWQGYPAKRSKSQKGADGDWARACRCIEQALAATDDDGKAIDKLRWPTGGIPTWQTATASVVLAACRPDRFTVVDSYALRTFMLLEGEPQSSLDATTYFDRSRWEPFMATCRELSAALKVSLRDLDRAFWASAGRRRPSSTA
jgi:hypothetical protein